MGLLSMSSDFFGLDIGTDAIRVVQMRGGSSKVLANYGSVDIDPRVTQSENSADRQKLAQAIRDVVSQSGITTPNVAVGLPSNKVFMSVVDVDRLAPEELDRSIRVQADALIPTPLDESKMDWALLGDSPKEASKVELLLTSVSNDFVEYRLDLLESLGLNVIAFEPNSMALTRALLAPGALEPTLVLHMDLHSSDLVITLKDAPRLVLSVPIGIENIIKAAIHGLNIDEKQARQFVFKFGMSKDKLEGQIYNAIHSTVDGLMLEIEKAIKFYNTRYPNDKIQKMIVTGNASTLPEFPLAVANRFGVGVEIGNSWRNCSFPADRQNELLSVSHEFAVAAGLAERRDNV